MDRKPGTLRKDPTKASTSLIWVKIIGIGDSNVGKTCLIKHFCESKFSNGYQPTVGVDYGFKIQNVEGNDLRVHLWDLSGNQEYLDVRNELYGGSDGVFLVYDITHQPSFDSLEVWLKELQRYGTQSSTIVLIGNKSDKNQQRAVDPNKAKQWAASHNIKYFETSCATGEGVESMFNELLETVCAKRNIKPNNNEP